MGGDVRSTVGTATNTGAMLRILAGRVRQMPFRRRGVRHRLEAGVRFGKRRGNVEAEPPDRAIALGEIVAPARPFDFARAGFPCVAIQAPPAPLQ